MTERGNCGPDRAANAGPDQALPRRRESTAPMTAPSAAGAAMVAAVLALLLSAWMVPSLSFTCTAIYAGRILD